MNIPNQNSSSYNELFLNRPNSTGLDDTTVVNLAKLLNFKFNALQTFSQMMKSFLLDQALQIASLTKFDYSIVWAADSAESIL